jgi:hypothetical protein
MLHPGGEAKPLCFRKRIFLFRLIKFEQESDPAQGWPAAAENYFARPNALAGFDELFFLI